MILSDRDIMRLIDNGLLEIDPYDPSNVQPASIDLRLGSGVIDATTGEETHEDTITFRPWSFYLATTKERVKIPRNVAGIVKGRSTVGRMGLLVITAGFADPSFRGDITLEVINFSNEPISLDVGSRVCQLVLFKTGDVLQDYEEKGGNYQDQRGVTPPVENNL